MRNYGALMSVSEYLKTAKSLLKKNTKLVVGENISQESSSFSLLYPEEAIQRDWLTNFLNEHPFKWDDSVIAKSKKSELLPPVAFMETDERTKGFSVFRTLYAVLYLASQTEEPGLSVNDREEHVRTRAASLMLIFGDVDSAVRYLKQYESSYKKDTRPVHNACLFDTPEEGCNLALWRGIVKQNPPNSPNNLIFSLLSMAKKIEEWHKDNLPTLERNIRDNEGRKEHERERSRLDRLDKSVKKSNEEARALLKDNTALNAHLEAHTEAFIQEKLATSLCPKTNLGVLKSYLSACTYRRAGENAQAAALFFKYNMREENFNAWLDMVHLAQDDPASIPAISLDGRTIHADYSGYILEKLSPKSPEAAVLGKMTSSCQSIGDIGDNPCRFGITDKDAGFYVIREKSNNRIVSQCLAWRGLDNNLVMDSIETKKEVRNKSHQMIINLFTALAHELVTSHNILAVSVGTGGETPKAAGVFKLNNPSKSKPGLSYGDSKHQRLVAHRDIPVLSAFIVNNKNITKLDGDRFCQQKILDRSTLWEYCDLLIDSGMSNLEIQNAIQHNVSAEDIDITKQHLAASFDFQEAWQENVYQSTFDWFTDRKEAWLKLGVNFILQKEEELIFIAAGNSNWEMVWFLGSIAESVGK
jgi:hypothetical protein